MQTSAPPARAAAGAAPSRPRPHRSPARRRRRGVGGRAETTASGGVRPSRLVSAAHRGRDGRPARERERVPVVSGGAGAPAARVGPAAPGKSGQWDVHRAWRWFKTGQRGPPTSGRCGRGGRRLERLRALPGGHRGAGAAASRADRARRISSQSFTAQACSRDARIPHRANMSRFARSWRSELALQTRTNGPRSGTARPPRPRARSPHHVGLRAACATTRARLRPGPVRQGGGKRVASSPKNRPITRAVRATAPVPATKPWTRPCVAARSGR